MQNFLPLTGNVHWLCRHGEVMYIDARVSSLRSGDIICPYDVNMVVVGCTAHNHYIFSYLDDNHNICYPRNKEAVIALRQLC